MTSATVPMSSSLATDYGGSTSPRTAPLIGRQIKLDDNLFTVIGVMPSSFENVLAPAAELWAPLQYDPSLPADGREWGHHLRMVGRLRQSVSANQARNELNAILRPLTQTYAKGYDSTGGPPDGMVINRLQDDITRAVKPALLAILGAVGLVLLIVCVNVTNLVLALGARRRSEFAMRAALGRRANAHDSASAHGKPASGRNRRRARAGRRERGRARVGGAQPSGVAARRSHSHRQRSLRLRAAHHHGDWPDRRTSAGATSIT